VQKLRSRAFLPSWRLLVLDLPRVVLDRRRSGDVRPYWDIPRGTCYILSANLGEVVDTLSALADRVFWFSSTSWYYLLLP
jgi:hypothetical protein